MCVSMYIYIYMYTHYMYIYIYIYATIYDLCLRAGGAALREGGHYCYYHY